MATPTSKFYLLQKNDGKSYLGRVRMFLNNEYINHKSLNIKYDFSTYIKKIKVSFENLSFKVDEPIMNATKVETMAHLKEDIDYFGCAVIFMCSRGEKDQILCYDYDDYDDYTENGKINVWNDYYHCFSGEEKPGLQKCPKFFFNDICHTLTNIKTKNVRSEFSWIFHNTAHWLIYNSTQPVFYTSADIFCKYLDEYAGKKDLEFILSMVKQEVSKIKLGFHDYCQPITYSSLVKKFYLLPADRVHQITSVYQKEFEHSDVIEYGNFGVVLRARHVIEKKDYAIKRIQHDSIDKFIEEIKFLQKFVKCPQIVGYHRVWLETIDYDYQSKKDFEHKIIGLSNDCPTSMVSLCYIQMELCDESLETWLKNKHQRDNMVSLNIFKQIVKGLVFIHKEDVIHGNVVPSNILFAITDKNSNNRIRIANFEKGIIQSKMKNEPPMCKKCDMYGAGKILMKLLGNSSEDCENIENDATFQKDFKFAVPTLKKLLSPNLDNRPSSEELLKILSTDLDWKCMLKEKGEHFESTISDSKNEFYILEGGYDEEDEKDYLGRVQIIINEFKDHKYLKQLPINDRDVNAIKKSFTKLNFKVDKEIMNLSKMEFEKHFKRDIDYFGCAVIFIFSHGDQDHIYCSDYDKTVVEGKTEESGKINVWRDYYAYFSGEKKPQLQKCPKFFFNEWCQPFPETPSHSDNKKKITDHSFHNTGHWLIYNAAVPGFYTYLHNDEGSYSTQAFCKRLDEFGQTKHLQDILTIVNNDVSKKYFNKEFEDKLGKKYYDDIYMQPIYSSSSMKKFYLLPENEIYKLTSIYRNEFEPEEKKLGEGNFGVVFGARNKIDKRSYAVKRIQLTENNESEEKRLRREINYLARFAKCPQIVGYNRVWYEFSDFNYESNQDLKQGIKKLRKTDEIIRLCYIQMERCDKSLEIWLKDTDQRNRVVSLKIFKQIVEGLDYLHKCNVVHRDIKPSNILFALNIIEEDPTIRIADFGLTRDVTNSKTSVTFPGTPLYMAPEVQNGKIDRKSDIFSAGLILVELLYNCSKDHDKKLGDVKKLKFPTPFRNELKFAVKTLRNLFSLNLSDRLSSDTLLKVISAKEKEWDEELKLAASREREKERLIATDSRIYILEGGRDEENFKFYGRVRIFINDSDNNHDQDVKAIRNSFEKLKFKVDEPYINKTKEEMITLFEEKIDYFGCAFIFIFNHGDRNQIYCSNCNKSEEECESNEIGKINIWKDYYRYFSGVFKPELNKCPKIFFNEWSQSFCESSSDLDKVFKDRFKNATHWLVYDAAQPGSCPTQAFCNRLDEFGETTPLEEILERFKIKESIHTKNMEPILHSCLVKKLYLLPKNKVYKLLSIYYKEFNHEKVIGNGQFSVVLEARSVNNNSTCAVKRIQLPEKIESEEKRIKREKMEFEQGLKLEQIDEDQLKNCRHILRIHRVWFESFTYTFQSKNDAKMEIYGLSNTGHKVHFCYIQMECCGDSLEIWLEKNYLRDKFQSLNIFKQIVQGLDFLHKIKVVHRNVKPSNILFALDSQENDPIVCISDFISARDVGESLYTAPEIVKGNIDYKSDMYSAGLVLVELLWNCSENHQTKLKNAKKGIFPKDHEFAVPTLIKLLSDNLDVRPSSDALLKILSTNPHWGETSKQS